MKPEWTFVKSWKPASSNVVFDIYSHSELVRGKQKIVCYYVPRSLVKQKQNEATDVIVRNVLELIEQKKRTKK